MRISDYEKIPALSPTDVLLLDTEAGTKTILAIDVAKTLLGLAPTNEILANVDLSDLDAAPSLEADDALLVGTENGNQRIKASDGFYKLVDTIPSVELRRNVWRGKNLGSVVTDEQWAEIGAGTFRNLFIGDYWSIGGRSWRIVDINYWWNTGDTPCTTPHLVIMPDEVLYNAQMNDTNTTNGGYFGSKMRLEGLNQAKTIIYGVFSSAHVLVHQELLTNAVTNGCPSAGAWYGSDIILPNEIMMYGCYVNTPAGNGTTIPYRYTIDKTQLALMQIYPKFINPHRESQWLRDVVSGTDFALVYATGNVVCNPALNSFGVRPVFGVKG